MKSIVLKLFSLAIGSYWIGNYIPPTFAEANYRANLSSTTKAEDLTSSCRQGLFNVLEDINSKEPQAIELNVDKQNERLDLSFTLNKSNVMASRGLQKYWSNLLYQYCPTVNEVRFGKAYTDWINRYILKNNRMIATFKDEPKIKGMEYGEARKQIIAAGWKPIKTRTYSYQSNYIDSLEAKFPEINDCAGSGLAPCIFYFENPDDYYYLKVVTLGQFFQDNDGRVSVVEVNSAMGGTEYGMYGQN